jgi:4-amino-4-deoxy-L-arabinose transferase-like glycosyltransferase
MNFIKLSSCLLLFIILSIIVVKTIDHPIYIFDEAIYANNSLEMAKNHSYLVYTNNDTTDHYNTKPPLGLWLQSISLSFFGFTDISIRIPSYLALLATILIIISYSRTLFNNILYGLVATLFLVTTYGLMRPHVFLSGDLDGLLVFFTTWIFFNHLKIIQQKKINKKDYVLMFTLFTLGYFTKSTAIFLVVPALLVSLGFNKQLKDLLVKKLFYVCVAGFIIIISCYYLLREKFDPGYFTVVWSTEFARLYNSIMPWQEQPFPFYFVLMWTRFIKSLLVLMLVCLPFYLLFGERKNSRILLHLFILSVIFLLTISVPKIKLEWYEAPVYPILCLASSILLLDFLKALVVKIKMNWAIIYIVVTILLFGLRFIEVNKKLSNRINILEPQEKEAAALKFFDRKYRSRNFSVLMDVEDNKMNHFDALNFYRKAIAVREKKIVTLYRYVSDVKQGDSIIVSIVTKIDSLKSKYTVKLIDSTNDTYYIHISEKIR